MAGHRKRRGRKRPLARELHNAYHVLSMVNTLSHVMHGDIGRLFKHLWRKRAHRTLGGWMK